jgi:hypothetical protein
VTEMLTYRASELPRLSTCPASAQRVALPLVSDGPEARLGTAVHEALASWITHKPLSGDLASKYQVDAGEIEQLCRLGEAQWSTLVSWFPEPETEVLMEYYQPKGGILLTGHADIKSLVRTGNYRVQEVRILDWKTGRREVDPTAQLKGYAWLAFHTHLEAERVYVNTVRLREKSSEGCYYEFAELEDWWLALMESLRAQTYNPGPSCRFCPRRLECPAKQEYFRDMVECVAESFNEPMPAIPAFSLHDLTAEQVGTILHRLRQQASWLRQMAENVDEYIKMEVYTRGGTVPVTTDTELRLEVQERTEIDGRRYREVEALLPQGIVEAGMRISKTRVEELLRAVTPAGLKGKMVEKFRTELAERHLLSSSFSERLELRSRAPTEIETQSLLTHTPEESNLHPKEES